MPLKRAHGSPRRERQHTRKQHHHHTVSSSHPPPLTTTATEHIRPSRSGSSSRCSAAAATMLRGCPKTVLLLPAPRQLQATVILWHGYGDLFVLETLSALKCCEHISVSSLLATSPIPFWHIQLDQDRSATRTSLCLVACYEVALVQFLPLTRF